MVRLEENQALANSFFEHVWSHLVERNSGKPGIEELFAIAKGKKVKPKEIN